VDYRLCPVSFACKVRCNLSIESARLLCPGCGFFFVKDAISAIPKKGNHMTHTWRWPFSCTSHPAYTTSFSRETGSASGTQEDTNTDHTAQRMQRTREISRLALRYGRFWKHFYIDHWHSCMVILSAISLVHPSCTVDLNRGWLFGIGSPGEAIRCSRVRGGEYGPDRCQGVQMKDVAEC
jgi:hypothetical protein